MGQAFGDDSFLVLPHPEVAQFYAARAANPDRWLGQMNGLQVEAGRPAPRSLTSAADP